MDKNLVEAIQQPPHPVPDLATEKARQQPAWTSGDHAVGGTTLQIVGEQPCEALDPLALIHQLNRSGDFTKVVPGECLEVVVARR